MADKTKRITPSQFDTALLEQVTHTRNMNVPVNGVASAASFALMLRKRLYGDTKLLAATNDCVARLLAGAKAERAQYEPEEQERARQAREQSQRQIVIPGDPRFRN